MAGRNAYLDAPRYATEAAANAAYADITAEGGVPLAWINSLNAFCVRDTTNDVWIKVQTQTTPAAGVTNTDIDADAAAQALDQASGSYQTITLDGTSTGVDVVLATISNAVVGSVIDLQVIQGDRTNACTFAFGPNFVNVTGAALPAWSEIEFAAQRVTYKILVRGATSFDIIEAKKQAAPTLSSISDGVDAAGAAAGGETVTLTGTNLDGTISVIFDPAGSPAAATSGTVVSSTSVTCVTPAHGAGGVEVQLVNTGSDVTTSATPFYTYS